MSNDLDINGDNKVDEKELAIHRGKLLAQRNMATSTLVAAFILTIVILSPIIPDDRLKILIDIIVMFYLMCGSIVGAFMGFSSYMSRK
jgi:hypothetical protein